AMTKGLRLLREVDLDPRGLGRLRSFSQGMKKRFALAAAQIGNPRYLLLDEIVNGLDPEGVHMVRRMVRDLRQRGIGVLLSSHILSEIERVADRMAVLHHAGF
ncbi:ABC transporter ATP-binding protein, partial [mine drainage metagenome]